MRKYFLIYDKKDSIEILEGQRERKKIFAYTNGSLRLRNYQRQEVNIDELRISCLI